MMKEGHRMGTIKQGNKTIAINKDELLDSIGTTAAVQINRRSPSASHYRYEATVWANRWSCLGHMGLYGIQDP